MANDNKFEDSLDSLLDRFKDDDSTAEIKVPDMPEKIVLPPDAEPEGTTVRKAEPKQPEINYGDNDLDDAIRAAEARDKAEREKKVQETLEAREANKPEPMPPQMYDEKAVDDDWTDGSVCCCKKQASFRWCS